MGRTSNKQLKIRNVFNILVRKTRLMQGPRYYNYLTTLLLLLILYSVIIWDGRWRRIGKHLEAAGGRYLFEGAVPALTLRSLGKLHNSRHNGSRPTEAEIRIRYLPKTNVKHQRKADLFAEDITWKTEAAVSRLILK
jgi:hypothetical protein